MDLVVVEVLQRQALARQHPRDGVRRRHQQSLVPVHVVDRGGLRGAQEGQRLVAVLGRPVLRREQHDRRTVGQRRGVAGRHGGRLPLAEHRLEGAELLDRGVGAQVLVALEAAERRHLVVEEPGVVRRREVLVRRRGQRVLLLAADLPLQSGQGGVLAHRQAGARLGVLRDRQPDVARPDLRQGRHLAHRVAGRVDLHQLLAELVADRDRRVGGGVRPSREADLDLPERDLVGHLDRRLEAGAAGLLDVGRRRLGRELGAQHALPSQVEVPGVLQHRPRDDLTEPLALQPEPDGETVDRGGEHVLVGRVGVDAVGAGERDAVAAQDGHTTGRGHLSIVVEGGHRANRMRGRSRKVDRECHRELQLRHDRPLPGLRAVLPRPAAGQEPRPARPRAPQEVRRRRAARDRHRPHRWQRQARRVASRAARRARRHARADRRRRGPLPSPGPRRHRPHRLVTSSGSCATSSVR